MHYRLYGIPAGLYPGKARSYLRKQGIDFVDVAPGSKFFQERVLPAMHRWINPVLETPEGALIQDTVDIIDHFERGPAQKLVRFSAYPTTPKHLAISHLFEMFGGEGLIRPAMHYRWNFNKEHLDFIKSEFALCFPQHLSQKEVNAAFTRGSAHLREATVNLGVTAESIPVIEESFLEWLNLFSAHLADHQYLLGAHATLGDYGLIAPLWQHLFRDPVPSMLIKRHAPLVGRWVERMASTQPYFLEHDDPETLIANDAVPDSLLAMMRFVAEEYLPEIRAHVDCANRWLEQNPDIEPWTNGLKDPGARGLGGGSGLGAGEMASFDWRGLKIKTGVLPYRFLLLQRLQDAVALASPADQEKVRSMFRCAGIEELLDLRTTRRVERKDNLEVWGPNLTD